MPYYSMLKQITMGFRLFEYVDLCLPAKVFYSGVLYEGFGVAIGNRERTKLWIDPWAGNYSLKMQFFFRIYALALNISKIMCEFKKWEGSVLLWNIEVRRIYMTGNCYNRINL